MNTNEIVYVVAYRETAETETDAEAWQDGDFEPYNYYNTEQEAKDITSNLRDELKSKNRKDVKIFIRKANRLWVERYLA